MANLTENTTLPFKAEDVIMNLSSYNLTSEESDVLKYGLGYAVPPINVNKTDVLVTFEKINCFLSKELVDTGNTIILKCEISHLANH